MTFTLKAEGPSSPLLASIIGEYGYSLVHLSEYFAT